MGQKSFLYISYKNMLLFFGFFTWFSWNWKMAHLALNPYNIMLLWHVLMTVKLRQGLFDATLCDSQRLAAGQWFSPGIPVSSTNYTDRHNITDIFLKVALITITLTLLRGEFLLLFFFFWPYLNITQCNPFSD